MWMWKLTTWSLICSVLRFYFPFMALKDIRGSRRVRAEGDLCEPRHSAPHQVSHPSAVARQAKKSRARSKKELPNPNSASSRSLVTARFTAAPTVWWSCGPSRPTSAWRRWTPTRTKCGPCTPAPRTTRWWRVRPTPTSPCGRCVVASLTAWTVEFCSGEETFYRWPWSAALFPLTPLLRTSPRWSWRRSKPSRRIRFSSELPLNIRTRQSLLSFHFTHFSSFLLGRSLSPLASPSPAEQTECVLGQGGPQRVRPCRGRERDKSGGHVGPQTNWCHSDVCSVTLAHILAHSYCLWGLRCW